MVVVESVRKDDRLVTVGLKPNRKVRVSKVL